MTPITPPPNSIVRLTLSVPPEIEPGGTVQLTVNAHRADGSVENVTSQTQWLVTNTKVSSSSASTVLSIDSAGLAHARDRGQVLVTAAFAGIKAFASVMVVPPGTFLYSMTLQDGPVGLRDASVTVTEGVGTGLTAVTDEHGTFHLFGVSGRIRWRATKDGYLDFTAMADVARHSPNAGNYYQMTPRGPREDLTGMYTLTITARADCAQVAAFPSIARQRTYTASVAGADSSFTVRLSGAEFVPHNDSGDWFAGQISSTGEAVFWLNFYFGAWAIVERLNGAAILFDGVVHARGSAERISGNMDGRMHVAAPVYPFQPITATCATDRFEMVRQ